MSYIGGTLSLTSQQLGPYCPVNFTCVGSGITSSLFWLVNGSEVAAYGYRTNHEFPFVLDVDPPLDGETAIVTDVDGPTDNVFNITSILSVSNVTVLNGASLQCEDSQDASNTLMISLLLSKYTPCTTIYLLYPDHRGYATSHFG